MLLHVAGFFEESAGGEPGAGVVGGAVATDNRYKCSQCDFRGKWMFIIRKHQQVSQNNRAFGAAFHFIYVSWRVQAQKGDICVKDDWTSVRQTTP